MATPRIRLLVGMIASGKSTYARQYARQGWVVVNDDSIVNAVHAGDYALYLTKLKPLYKSVENHIAAVAIGMGYSVLVDRGVNIRRSSRVRWVGLAGSLDVPCDAVVFPNAGPEEHALRRFSSDPRGHTREYWEKVARCHNNDFEVPSEDEGLAQVIQHVGYR